MEKMIRLHFRFFGSVQGVGFRYTARHAADRYRVTGWVKNEYDGSVTCEVQGRKEDIEAWQQFIEQARFINVDRVEKNVLREDPDERSFDVRY